MHAFQLNILCDSNCMARLLMKIKVFYLNLKFEKNISTHKSLKSRSKMYFTLFSTTLYSPSFPNTKRRAKCRVYLYNLIHSIVSKSHHQNKTQTAWRSTRTLQSQYSYAHYTSEQQSMNQHSIASKSYPQNKTQTAWRSTRALYTHH